MYIQKLQLSFFVFLFFLILLRLVVVCIEKKVLVVWSVQVGRGRQISLMGFSMIGLSHNASHTTKVLPPPKKIHPPPTNVQSLYTIHMSSFLKPSIPEQVQNQYVIIKILSYLLTYTPIICFFWHDVAFMESQKMFTKKIPNFVKACLKSPVFPIAC